MYHFRSIIFLTFLLCLFTSCKGGQFDFSNPNLLIVSNGDKLSVGAADYLFNHVKSRNNGKLRLQRSEEVPKNFLGGVIYVEVVGDLAYDYEIRNEEGRLSIFGKNKQVLQWITYMLIDHLNDFQPMKVEDLPPHYISFETGALRFAFDYREPHLLPNIDIDNSGVLFTNNVDRDWGLWGHNLHHVFAGHPPIAALALVNGERKEDQYCFSAAETYRAIQNFVINEYGRGDADSKNFMIAPNDNDIVCTCALCHKAGNTAGNGSPAVISLLNRLATAFPKHHFYTTAYRTTMSPSSSNMLENTGVFLSTIDLPKAGRLDANTKAVREFSSLVKDWRGKTNHVYLWDYIANFDDYLTPFPVMRRVQHQLTFFNQQGVKGLFLNGSGYDYTPFDDVKTYVLSALMIDPSLVVDKLVQKFYQRFYPVTGDLLSTYLLDMEDWAEMKNLDIEVYTPFRKAMKSYFDPAKGTTLYRALLARQPQLKGEEEVRVKKIITALSYSQLQINYEQATLLNGFFEQEGDNLRLSATINKTISAVGNYKQFENLSKYKEENGALETYVKEWESWKRKKIPVNLLKTVKVQEIPSETALADANLLINNVPGFLSDFNQGWFLSGESIQIEGERIDLSKKKVELNIQFLINKKHRMLAPERVEVWSANQLIAKYTESSFHLTNQSALLLADLVLGANAKISIKIFKSNQLKNSVIACDEIFLF